MELDPGMDEKQSPPIVSYADIYKKDTVYVGERKIDSASQADFHYGDGSYVVSFMYKKSNEDAMKGGAKAAMRGQMRDRQGKGAQLKAKETNKGK